MGTGWADPRAAHDDALFGRVGNSSSSTPRHTPPSLQTLLVGRLLGPVGVLRGASTHATRRSPPYQLDANWPPPRSRGSRSTSALCVAWFGSDGRRVYPQRLPNARGGEGSLKGRLASCKSLDLECLTLYRRATTTQPSTPQRLWIGTRFATSCLSGSRHRCGVLPRLPTTTV